MKTKPIYIGLAALSIILLTLPSCKKDSADTQALALKVQAINNTYSVPTSEGNPIPPVQSSLSVHWDVAQMFVSTIDIDAAPATSGGAVLRSPVNMTWYGPKLVDLFNLSQTLGRINIPPGNYNEIEFTINARNSDAGQSALYLSGTYRNVLGKSYPLIVDVTNDLKIMTEKHNVLIGAGQGSEVNGLVRIYLDRLFSKILPNDLDEASMTDGKIIISANYNQSLYNLILENLKTSGDSDDSNNDQN